MRHGGKRGEREMAGGCVMRVWLLIVLSGWLTRVLHAARPSPSVDNAVSYTSLLRLIKNRQIDVTSMVELYLTLASSSHAHTRAHAHTHTAWDRCKRYVLKIVIALKYDYVHPDWW